MTTPTIMPLSIDGACAKDGNGGAESVVVLFPTSTEESAVKDVETGTDTDTIELVVVVVEVDAVDRVLVVDEFGVGRIVEVGVVGDDICIVSSQAELDVQLHCIGLVVQS